MRKVFFVGLIAMLTGCSQESRVSSPEDSGIELQINLSLGSVSTRAVDDPITGNDGEGYVLPFTEVKTLKVDLYKSLEAAPIFTWHQEYRHRKVGKTLHTQDSGNNPIRESDDKPV